MGLGCSGDDQGRTDTAGPDGADSAVVETEVGGTTPVDSGPEDSTPVDSGPADSTPVDSVPADSTPVDSVPADSTPVDSGMDSEAEIDSAETTAGNECTVGSCLGAFLLDCTAGHLTAVDCPAQGLTCGVGSDGVVACIAPGTTCTTAPACVSGNAVGCSSATGVATRIACEELGGATCTADANGARCVPDADTAARCASDRFLVDWRGAQLWTITCGAGIACAIAADGSSTCDGPGCGDATALGHCDGNALTFCAHGFAQTFPCTGATPVCGYDPAAGQYDCLPATAACGDLTESGRCVADRLEFCVDGRPFATDCAAEGASCVETPSVPPEAFCDRCHGETYFGRCDDQGAAVWCEDETVRRIDCAALDTTCEVATFGSECSCDPATFAPTCVGGAAMTCDPVHHIVAREDCAELGGTCALQQGAPVCVGGGCGTETYQGRCDGETAVWCDHALVHAKYCPGDALVCGFDPEAGLYDCVNDVGDCGTETVAGRCDGTTLVRCETTVGTAHVVTLDCADQLESCQEVSPGHFGCAPSPCGDVPAEGRCGAIGGSAENTWSYCESGVRYDIDCAAHGQVCGVAGAGNGCVDAPNTCGAVTFVGQCDANVLSYCDGHAVVTDDCGAKGLVCAYDPAGQFNNCLPDAATCDPACDAGFSCHAGSCHPDGTTPREWTVMVYLAADNTLAGAALGDINEMEMAGSSPSVAVVAEAEFSSSYGALYGLTAPFFDNTFRFAVQADGNPSGLDGSTIVQGAIGNQDMGSPAGLSDFITWAAKTYPAKHYALFLWNHGAGWWGGIEDDTSGTHLSLGQIHEALRDAGVFIDVLDFDACLMAQYELTQELDDSVGYLVASEETEPGDGDPYDRFLGDLQQAPATAPKAFAEDIVTRYVESYAGGTDSVTKAAIDLSQASVLDGSVSALATALTTELVRNRTPIYDAIGATQNYQFRYYRDLGDFSRLLAGDTRLSSGLRSAATTLHDLLAGDSLIVRRGSVDGSGAAPSLARSTGLSAFLPLPSELVVNEGFNDWEAYATKLSSLQRATAWTTFIRSLAVSDPSALAPASGTITVYWNGDSLLALYLIDPLGHIYGSHQVQSAIGEFGSNIGVTGTRFATFAFHDYVPAGAYTILVLYEMGTEESYVQLDIDVPVALAPRSLRRALRDGTEVPMSLTHAYADPIDGLVHGTVTDDDISAWSALTYSNVWLVGSITIPE